MPDIAKVRVYRDRKKLGSGAFGNVYPGELVSSGDKCAVKIMEDADSFVAESTLVVALTKHHHPRIITYFGLARHTRKREKDREIVQYAELVLVMELANAGSLQDLLDTRRRLQEGPLDEETALRFTCQLLEGLDFLHQKLKHIHRDLKPGNILLVTNETGVLSVKIADLGISHFMADEDAEDWKGTLLYIAPEVHVSRLERAYTCKVDVYSLVCVLIYMLLLEPVSFNSFEYCDEPQRERDEGERNQFWFTRAMRSQSIRLKRISTLLPNCSQRTTDFMQRMSESDPDKRASVEELLEDEAQRELVDRELLARFRSAPDAPSSSSSSSSSDMYEEMSFIVLEGNEPPGNSEQAGRLEHLTRVECFHDDKTYGCRVWTLVAWDGERRVVHFDQDRKNNRTKFREFHEQVIAAGFQLTFLQAESIKTQIDYAKSPPE